MNLNEKLIDSDEINLDQDEYVVFLFSLKISNWFIQDDSSEVQRARRVDVQRKSTDRKYPSLPWYFQDLIHEISIILIVKNFYVNLKWLYKITKD